MNSFFSIYMPSFCEFQWVYSIYPMAVVTYIKRQLRNGLFILLHTHINTPSWPCHINYGSLAWHTLTFHPFERSAAPNERQMPQKLPLATQLLFSYLPLRILSLFSHCILPCNHFHPLSRPLYWYFSAFSRSPLSPIAATVGFELSHFSSLHFLLSAAIICTWRMPFLIIIPDKRSRSPSSAKRMCI